MHFWRRTSRGLRVVLPAGLLLTAVGESVWAQYSLKSRRDFSVGDHPVQVITADYDGDGLLDLITADQISSGLSLMRGFGDGTFRRVAVVTAGTNTTGVALADVNNDGRRDLVASNILTVDVTVNLGDGMGGFGPKIRSLVSVPTYGLTVGDWNADGKLDVATVNTTRDSISTLRGVGDGTFGNVLEIAVGDNPSQVLTSDFNADGKADLVVVNGGSDTVQVWRGNGLGAFTLANTLNTGTGSGPESAAIADLNVDTRPDLVVCNPFTNEVKVYLANTSGGFLTPTTLTPGLEPHAATATDMNKDGHLDLIVGMAHFAGVGELAVMIGNGAGGFAAATVTSTSPLPSSVTAGDYNRDGNMDVVTASLTGNTLSVLETTVNGAFIVAGKVQLDASSYPASIVSADFNADGKPDLATANQLSDDVSVMRGDGLGGFLNPSNNSTGSSSSPQALVLVDANRDGTTDLVTVNQNNTMSVLMNNGNANFSSTNGLAIGLCDTPSDIASGEISGDVNRDLAFVCQVSNHLCTRRGTGGSGSSAFGATVCTLLDAAPSHVALGQFDYDALEDMAVTVPDMNWVEIAISDGFGGVFDIPATFSTGESPQGVTRSDLDMSGEDDLVVANAASATVSALLGDGGGALGSAIDSPAGQAPVDVAIADLNLDGKPDAAVVNASANNVSFLLGDGFGHFSKAGDFGTRDLPLSVGVGDFNLDGKPDLAVADNLTDTVTILINQSILSDPLQSAQVFDEDLTFYRWGLVPGAVYDVIRGTVGAVTEGPSSFNLGPVTCLADNLPVTDTANTPDASVPPVGQAYFYLVRPIVAGVPGPYTISTTGKPGIPGPGGCL